MPPERLLGKYRAMVVSNVDPMRLGRLQVQAVDHSLFPSTWAMPCVPFTGLQTGMFVLPPPGAGVWVEFEQGDPDHPIWVGGFWGTAAEVPTTVQSATPGTPILVVQTAGQHAVAISDGPLPPWLPAGGVALKSGASSVVVDPTGVKITGPRVEINGLLLVNNGALTVTV